MIKQLKLVDIAKGDNRGLKYENDAVPPPSKLDLRLRLDQTGNIFFHPLRCTHNETKAMHEIG